MKNHHLFAALLLIVNACVPKQEAIEINPYKIEEGDAPLIVAHRGGRNLFPENTMIAFQGSANLGVDILEMDVAMTKDETLITCHDLTIDRTSNGSGNVIDYTYSELSQFNFGYHFTDLDGNKPFENVTVPPPRLEDIFAAFRDHKLMIEIKDRDENGKRAAEILQSLIEQYELQNQVIVVAFSEAVLDYYYEITNGEILVGISEEEAKRLVFSGLSGMEFLFKPRAAIAAFPTESSGIKLSSKRVVNSAHRRNMGMYYWTINNKETMRMLIEAGADGLITDRPDLMQEVLFEMGY